MTTAQTVYVEGQHDPARGTVTLVASTGGDRHAVSVAFTSPEEAAVKLRDWATMYQDIGCRVVLASGKTLEPR